MSNAIYAALARQTGLMNEMQVVANNIANASTTGYKSDRAVFAEFIAGGRNNLSDLSMGSLAGHSFNMEQGGLRMTGGRLDLAVQGDGLNGAESNGAHPNAQSFICLTSITR